MIKYAPAFEKQERMTVVKASKWWDKFETDLYGTDYYNRISRHIWIRYLLTVFFR